MHKERKSEVMNLLNSVPLTNQEWAEKLKVCERTIYRWRSADGTAPQPRQLARLKKLLSLEGKILEQVDEKRQFTQADIDLLQRMLLALKPFSLAYAFDLVKKRNT